MCQSSLRATTARLGSVGSRLRASTASEGAVRATPCACLKAAAWRASEDSRMCLPRWPSRRISSSMRAVSFWLPWHARAGSCRWCVTSGPITPMLRERRGHWACIGRTTVAVGFRRRRPRLRGTRPVMLARPQRPQSARGKTASDWSGVWSRARVFVPKNGRKARALLHACSTERRPARLFAKDYSNVVTSCVLAAKCPLSMIKDVESLPLYKIQSGNDSVPESILSGHLAAS